MRALAIAWLGCLAAACQPMYGGKPQKLKDPPPIAHRGDDTGEPPKKAYVEQCTTDFHARPPAIGIKRNTATAHEEVKTAGTRLQEADKAPERTGKQRLILEAIDRYHRALSLDPFDAEATVKLALAYDRTLRKGCALALLRRLQALANHPAFEVAANAEKQRVRDNKHWFADYRSEALREIP